MPSHEVHKEISRLIWGVKGDKIHQRIDSGYTTWGSEHRKHQPHDLISAMLIGSMSDPENPVRGGLVGATHVITDEIFAKRRNGRQRK